MDTHPLRHALLGFLAVFAAVKQPCTVVQISSVMDNALGGILSAVVIAIASALYERAVERWRK